MHEIQEELLRQQRIVAGCLLRKEMRECGIWAPMPRMDGVELSAALSARFPRNASELKNMGYGDKTALVQEYGLPWSKESSEDPGDILYQFITGKNTATLTVNGGSQARAQKDEKNLWVLFVPMLALMVFLIIIIKIAPPEAFNQGRR